MKVAVLGSGVVGRTLAASCSSLGHGVVMGTRDVAKTLASKQTGPMTQQTFAQWNEANSDVVLGTFAEAAAHGEVAFVATGGGGTLAALSAAGAANLAGKILIDVTNPLDFTRGFPPTLLVSNDDSLGERIQREFPDARVVKALNTVTAPLMVNPAAAGAGDHHMFVCGNDAGAKDEVTGMLREWFGWRHVMDLGDITAARGQEMYLPLWLRLMGATGTPMFNIRIVT